jgi:hypothetical protein
MKIEVTLNKPHFNQQLVLSQAKRFNILNCGRRWGKSVLAINLLSETAIEGFPAGYFAPTYKLLEITFKETLNCLQPIVQRKHDNQFIELITGGVIDFWSLENPVAGRSRKYKRSIIDEAAFVKSLSRSWTESIRPTLTDLKGDAWFMSTPRGKNDFYKMYSYAKGGVANWMCWQMPTSTNPFIDPLELLDAKNDLPELAYSQEYEAEFSEDVANPFGYEYIDNAIRLISKNPSVCFGVDLAKSNDYTVLVGLDQNGQVSYYDRWQSDWDKTKKRIIQTIGNKPTRIDSTGVGDPIAEEVMRSCSGAEGFVFTSISKQQIMEGLVASLQKQDLFIIKELVDELKSFEYVYTRTGVRYSAPPGLHDDKVCALALANSIRHRAAASANANSYGKGNPKRKIQDHYKDFL